MADIAVRLDDKQRIVALDGKLFARLTSDELEVVRYWRDRGRSDGIRVAVGEHYEWQLAAEAEIRRTNARVRVEVINHAK